MVISYELLIGLRDPYQDDKKDDSIPRNYLFCFNKTISRFTLFALLTYFMKVRRCISSI